MQYAFTSIVVSNKEISQCLLYNNVFNNDLTRPVKL